MAKRRSKKAKQNRRILFAAAALIVLLGLLLFFFKAPKVVLKENLKFTVGEKVLLSDVVSDVKGGSLIDPDQVLDSSKEGSQKVLFTVKNRFGFKKEESFMIEWIAPKEDPKNEESPKEEEIQKPEDPKEEVPVTTTQPPNAQAPQENLAQGANGSVLYETKNEIFLWQGDTLDLAEHFGGAVSGSYSFDTAGTYPITVTTEKNGKETKKEVKLTVLASPFGEKGALIDGTYKTAKGFTITVQNSTAYIDGILIANKSFSLPKTYTSSYLAPDAEAAFYKMRDAAAAEGVDISKIKSAYRSWNDQNYIFNGYVRDDSLENALTYSARPGHSEHQTGLAMDLITSGTAESQIPEFAARLAWLKDNAQRFGFILRYPEGKTPITGYIFEPWHYRYVGTDLAAKLYNGGHWITLEEYFGIDSIYRGY